MPAWQKPDLPDGPLRALNDELHRLHAFSGYRSSYQIQAWLKARATNHSDLINDWMTPSHTLIHRTLTQAVLPNRAVVNNLVEAFIALGRIQNGRDVLDKIDQLWTEAYDEDHSHPAPANSVDLSAPVPEPEPPDTIPESPQSSTAETGPTKQQLPTSGSQQVDELFERRFRDGTA